jgi:hypothetical protein
VRESYVFFVALLATFAVGCGLDLDSDPNFVVANSDTNVVANSDTNTETDTDTDTDTCVADTLAETCANLECGSLVNNCGDTVVCGTCKAPATC